MERRSAFRFRLPWSQPAAPPTPAATPARTTSNQPNTKTRSSPTATPSSSPTNETKTRNQPTSTTTTTTSTKPSSPARPSASTQARNEAPKSTTTPTPRSPTPLPKPSAEKNASSQPSTTSTSPLPETPALPPQPPAEIKAPIQPSTTITNSTPENTPASLKSETQTPTNVITTNPTSTIAKSPPSSPPGISPTPSSQTPVSRTEFQPLIPSQEQHGITSQPASPNVATKSRVSQPPSPSRSRSAPRTQEMTPTSSPTRKGPQVLSADQLTSKSPRPASRTSNLPSGITSPMQPKDHTIAQPTSPLKPLQESSEHSSKPTETLPSSSGKKTKKSTAIQPESEQMELFPKETISDTVMEGKVRSPEKVMQPSEPSEVKSTRGITEGPSQISKSSGITGESKTFIQSHTNIKETREVKEVVQETRDKTDGAGEKNGSFMTSKDHQSIVFQAKQAYKEKQVSSENDQIRVSPFSNGKHTTVSSQLKNKRVVSGNSEEAAVSTEKDIPLHNEIKDDISKFRTRMAVGDGKQNLEERPVNVITLAGDNRGASMQLGSDSYRKDGAIHIRRGYKLNSEKNADATTDAEGSSEGRLTKDARTMEDQEIEAYLNCNVQALNNSIIFDSSVAVKSPGIHMSLPRMISEPMNSSDKRGAVEAHKAEYSVTPSQKLTYEPTIRRRCLRGLFHEFSDSDPDDPEKPRRHGCRIGCTEKSTENEIDIL